MMCGSRKSILPPQKGLQIPGRRGVSKSQKFKAMYEATLEFPEGWGGHKANPFCGGYGYFLETHNVILHKCAHNACKSGSATVLSIRVGFPGHYCCLLDCTIIDALQSKT